MYKTTKNTENQTYIMLEQMLYIFALALEGIDFYNSKKK